MSSREEKLRYLGHHWSYELLMLRYTYARLHDTKHKLMWNAFLEAFAIHARNFEMFLRNDKDSRNSRAELYVKFCAPGPPTQIKQKVGTYVVHPGTSRSKEGDEKFNLERAEKAYAWIEEFFALFLEALPPDDRHEYWRPELADPNNYKSDSEDGILEACTHPLFVTLKLPLQQQTHTSHIETFSTKFP